MKLSILSVLLSALGLALSLPLEEPTLKGEWRRTDSNLTTSIATLERREAPPYWDLAFTAACIGCANSAALTAGIAGFSVRAGAIPSSLSNHFALIFGTTCANLCAGPTTEFLSGRIPVYENWKEDKYSTIIASKTQSMASWIAQIVNMDERLRNTPMA